MKTDKSKKQKTESRNLKRKTHHSNEVKIKKCKQCGEPFSSIENVCDDCLMIDN